VANVPLMGQVSISKILRKDFLSYDIYIACTLAMFTLLAIVYYPKVANASNIISQDFLIAIVVAALIAINFLTKMPLATALRRFYVIPVIWLLYDQVHMLVRVVNPADFDLMLIEADRAIFGLDPTAWFSLFSNPFLTEFLQICYFSFYILPIMQAIELWKRGEIDKLDVFLRAIVFCYMVSYLAYFILPAVGPRFTLHKFDQLDVELPGLFLTSIFRSLVEVGGGIPLGASNPVDIVNRDCMPSGHTMLTLVNIIMAFRLNSRFKWLFVVVGGSLIISTVYLRYHYVIDVLVGAVLAVIFLTLEPYVHRKLQNSTLRD